MACMAARIVRSLHSAEVQNMHVCVCVHAHTLVWIIHSHFFVSVKIFHELVSIYRQSDSKKYVLKWNTSNTDYERRHCIL
jgi:hypothetical protein